MGATAAIYVAAAVAASQIYQGYQDNKALQESAKLQEAAGNEAKKVSEENAARIEAEGAEEQRRLAAKQSQEEASARSKAAASGAVYNADEEKPDSLVTVLTSQKTENKRQLDWEMAATKSQSAAERRKGEYERQMSFWQAKGLKSQGKAAIKSGWISGAVTFGTAAATPGAWGGSNAGAPAANGQQGFRTGMGPGR